MHYLRGNEWKIMSHLKRRILESIKTAQVVSGPGLQEKAEHYLGLTFILNNNSGKRSRVYLPEHGGQNPSKEQLFAHYDSFGGLVLLAPNRLKVPDGIFWSHYKAKLERREKWKKLRLRLSGFSRHPIIVAILIAIIFFVVYRFFGVDLNNPSSKTPESFQQREREIEADLVSSGYNLYTNSQYGISFQYPSGWTKNEGYCSGGSCNRYEGTDGFFMISAGNASSLEEFVRADAYHKLKPYGTQPTIKSLTIQGREAQFIFPSSDQQEPYPNQTISALIIDKGVELSSGGYGFTIIWADRNHIEEIAKTVKF